MLSAKICESITKNYSKKARNLSISSILLGSVFVLSPPVLAASSFGNHLWQFANNSATNVIDFNKGSSMIYDNVHLHVSTDDYLFLDAPVLTTVQSSMLVKNELQIGNNAPIFGGAYVGSSRIYDNYHLHIATDDNLYLDAPVLTTVQAALTVGGMITGNLTGAVTGNASTATALAVDPTDCATDTYATAIAANGDLTCASITDASLSANVAKYTDDTPIFVNTVAAPGFSGNLTGDVTGNVTTDVINATASNVVLHIGESTDQVALGHTGNLTSVAGALQVVGTITGNLTGNVTGNTSGTAATVTDAAQPAITSVGTLTGLNVVGAPAVNGTGAIYVDSSLSTNGGSVYQSAIKGLSTLDAGYGSSTITDPSVAFGMWGKVAGTDLTGTSNYTAGTSGIYGIQGTNASLFPKAGLLGAISAGSTSADAAVMALIDGDSGLTTARAGYGIMTLNSTGGSGFDYGMDLKIQVVTGLESEMQPFKVADIRLSSGTTISSGDTNPATCVKGSIYLNTTSGLLNVCETADVWTAL